MTPCAGFARLTPVAAAPRSTKCRDLLELSRRNVGLGAMKCKSDAAGRGETLNAQLIHFGQVQRC